MWPLSKQNTEKAQHKAADTHTAAAAHRGQRPLKQVLLTLLILVALLALLGGTLWQNICYNRTHYTAEFYQIHSRKLTQSCRVVFLTDLHLREYGADNCELVQDVRSLAPDLILLGGDFVTYGEGTNYDNMLSLFRQLSEIAPVCGVLGNHEDELYFLTTTGNWWKVHRRRGDRPAQSGGALYHPRQRYQHSGRGGQPGGFF